MARKRTHPDWFDEDGKPIEDELEEPVGSSGTFDYPSNSREKEYDEERIMTDGGVRTPNNESKTLQGERSPDYWASKFGFESADSLYSELQQYNGDTISLNDFADDYGISRENVDAFGKALAAISNFRGYDLGISMSSDGSRDIKLG